MNKIYSILFAVLALGVGIGIGSTDASFAAWPFGDDEKVKDDNAFIKGSAVDQEDRPSGVFRYFSSGDPMNECLWDIVASEACQRGILFDNQENMNRKLNWLLEKQGYDFGE